MRQLGLRRVLPWITAGVSLFAPPVCAQVAVRAATLYTMAGAPIEDGVVVIREGKIVQVGSASEVIIPPGFEILEAAVATPGLIDAHTVVGLSGYLNQPHDQDQLEASSAVPKTRVVLFEAAIALAHGLTFEEALNTVTLEAARILAIDHRVGSLEPGKDGDVALFDGDPFKYTTRTVGVVIEGEVVSREPR